MWSSGWADTTAAPTPQTSDVESLLFCLLPVCEEVMSEAAYNADPDPAPASNSGGEANGASPGHGPITIDTTYPRSIEGILKIVTVVSWTSPILKFINKY